MNLSLLKKEYSQLKPRRYKISYNTSKDAIYAELRHYQLGN